MPDDGLVQCRECGTKLAEPPNTPLADRQPCPNCGSARRQYAIGLEAVLSVTSALWAEGVVARGVNALKSDPRLTPIKQIGRRIVWHEPTEGSTEWLTEVYDDNDRLLGAGAGDNTEDALLDLAEHLQPPKDV
jgi:hypothetical protein